MRQMYLKNNLSAYFHLSFDVSEKIKLSYLNPYFSNHSFAATLESSVGWLVTMFKINP